MYDKGHGDLPRAPHNQNPAWAGEKGRGIRWRKREAKTNNGEALCPSYMKPLSKNRMKTKTDETGVGAAL